jgi:hypothetical protein
LCNISQLETVARFSPPVLEIGVGDERWKNYQLSFDVKDFEFVYDPDLGIYTTQENFHIRMRKVEDAAYHFSVFLVGYKNLTEGFTPDASHVNLYKDQSKSESIPLLGAKGADFAASIENCWYPVIIEVNAGDLQFYWNNELVIDYHDEEYLAEGAISFLSNYGTCFDNMRVTAISHEE